MKLQEGTDERCCGNCRSMLNEDTDGYGTCFMDGHACRCSDVCDCHILDFTGVKASRKARRTHISEDGLVDKSELSAWWTHIEKDVMEESVGCPYPQCTEVWNAMPQIQQSEVYLRMGGRKAHRHHDWKKGNTSMT